MTPTLPTTDLLSPFIEDPLELQLRLKLQRANRLWKYLLITSAMLTIAVVALLALMIGLNKRPVAIMNDLLESLTWTSLSDINTRTRTIHSVHVLNEGRPVLPIHSHNDYWRKQPLFDALGLGVQSVEADIWSLGDYELFVGHRYIKLRSSHTLRKLYTGPLERLLDSVNTNDTGTMKGVFDDDPSKTLYLYLDIKNDPASAFQLIQLHLQPLISKGYVTTYNKVSDTWYQGPLTVIISGEYPIEEIASMNPRTMFIDAPLVEFDSFVTQIQQLRYDRPISTVSIQSSAALRRIINSKGTTPGGLTPQERELIQAAFKRVHDAGVMTRVWDTPTWPVEQRDAVWSDLIELGVDLLNADDLMGAVNVVSSSKVNGSSPRH